MAAPSDRARTLADAAEEAAGCQACPLWANATQTVFGAGHPNAELMLVGEQPGDVEDREGSPFVGPAGRMLDRALGEIGLERDQVYVTNAVKHFKWRPRGKRRIHQKPNRAEVAACQRWLHAELELVAPGALVALGATAGQALFGSSFRVGASRGKVLEYEGRSVVATIHPSAILRTDPGPDRDDAFGTLVEALGHANRLVHPNATSRR